MNKTPIERLLEKTDKNSQPPPHAAHLGNCWNWTGAKRPGGYGTFMAHKVVSVHRFIYEHHFGDIPNGHDVMHRCDNRACVNPFHLTTGTRKQNMEDCLQKGRTSRGESHSDLKNETVFEIRKLHKSGVSQAEIQRRLNLGRGCVHKIVHNQRWVHLLKPEGI